LQQAEVFHYYVAATTIREVDRGVVIFMLFALILDIYKNSSMYLASTGENLSLGFLRKRKQFYLSS
jgi:hypothetical protein